MPAATSISGSISRCLCAGSGGRVCSEMNAASSSRPATRNHGSSGLVIHAPKTPSAVKQSSQPASSPLSIVCP